MPCTTREALSTLDDIESRLYNARQFFRFLEGMAAVSAPNAQLDEVSTESAQVVFGCLADELVSLQNTLLTKLRQQIAPAVASKKLKGNSNAD